MPNILDFRILEFSPLYSYADCPIALTLNILIIDDPNCIENNPSISKPKLWDSDKSESFVNNIDIVKVADIELHLDSIQNKNNASKEEIDEIVLGVGTLFEATAKETFGSINMKKNSKTVKPHAKPWFNAECSRARNMYHRIRRLYNKYKTDYYKIY